MAETCLRFNAVRNGIRHSDYMFTVSFVCCTYHTKHQACSWGGHFVSNLSPLRDFRPPLEHFINTGLAALYRSCDRKRAYISRACLHCSVQAIEKMSFLHVYDFVHIPDLQWLRLRFGRSNKMYGHSKTCNVLNNVVCLAQNIFFCSR